MAAESGQQVQSTPIRVYQGPDRIMVATPMPGLEPTDISVSVLGETVTIHGEYRGPHQDERDLVTAEWATGPHHREVQLPGPVNGALTNATYGNGVLVLVLPKLRAGQRPTDGETEFRLQVVDAPHGERVGHAGRDLHEVTTEAHLRQVAETARRASEVH